MLNFLCVLQSIHTMQRASYSKLETMISRLEQRKSSLSDQSSAIGEDMITEGWTLVSAAGRTLKQVRVRVILICASMLQA